MRTIHKFQIEISAEQTLKASGRIEKVLSAGLDGESVPCIWAFVDTDPEDDFHTSMCVTVLPTVFADPVSAVTFRPVSRRHWPPVACRLNVRPIAESGPCPISISLVRAPMKPAAPVTR